MVLALGLALVMAVFPAEVMAAARQGCQLWAQAVMPGLLPFLVCLLYAAGRMKLPKGRPDPFTGLSRAGRRVMLMGLVTGSPGAARLMSEAAVRGLLSPVDGLRLAIWGGSMSPMFLLGTLTQWLAWPQAGWRLLCAHWLGVFCAGQAARLFPVKACPQGREERPPKMTVPMAIEGAVRALLAVCGCMVMGCTLSALMGKALPHMAPWLSALFQCLVEVTAGCRQLILQGAPVWILAGAVSLGGLSLLLQNLVFWPRGWFSLGWVLLGRLMACGISLGAGWLLFQGTAAPVFAPGPLPLVHPSLMWLAAYLILCLIPLALKD